MLNCSVTYWPQSVRIVLPVMTVRPTSVAINSTALEEEVASTLSTIDKLREEQWSTDKGQDLWRLSVFNCSTKCIKPWTKHLIFSRNVCCMFIIWNSGRMPLFAFTLQGVMPNLGLYLLNLIFLYSHSHYKNKCDFSCESTRSVMWHAHAQSSVERRVPPKKDLWHNVYISKYGPACWGSPF